MTKILQPLWMLLAWATEPEMVRMIDFACDAVLEPDLRVLQARAGETDPDAEHQQIA